MFSLTCSQYKFMRLNNAKSLRKARKGEYERNRVARKSYPISGVFGERSSADDETWGR